MCVLTRGPRVVLARRSVLESGARVCRSGLQPRTEKRRPGRRVVIAANERAWQNAVRVARHRRHGVNATPSGNEPTGMSVGFLVLVFTSIVDTDPALSVLVAATGFVPRLLT
jgi:hypothetical protein